MIDFESNTKLVYYVYNRKFKKHRHLKDDLIQNGLIGLWKACKNFDETKNTSFGCYACKCIANEMIMLFRSEKKDLIEDEDFDFSSVEDNAGDINLMIDIKREIDGLNNKKIFELWLKGYTQKEIGNIVGKSQSRVCRNIKTMQGKIREALNEKN